MIIDPIVKPASDRSILIQFGSKISEDIHEQIVYYSNVILNSQSSYINNISPAYCSILVRLKNEVTMDEMLFKLKDIETPRLKTPRTVVPAGSVAIGGNQTGIYPIQSPGGWNVIGRTYLTLFEWENIDDSLIKIGTKIEFYRITKHEFLKFRKSL